ncbi:hypothetical protein Mapa_005897 [Marchantia paleacea]|nr:hypothetical protein Mapa_005897 [Marchantia paleacea]
MLAALPCTTFALSCSDIDHCSPTKHSISPLLQHSNFSRPPLRTAPPSLLHYFLFREQSHYTLHHALHRSSRRLRLQQHFGSLPPLMRLHTLYYLLFFTTSDGSVSCREA